MAILATVLTERITSHLAAAAGATGGPAAARHAALLGYHDAFFAAVVIGIVGVAFAFLIHDEDAAGTMRATPGERAMTEAAV